MKAIVTYKRSANWTKANNYRQSSTLLQPRQKSKWKEYTLWLPWKAKMQQIHGPMCFKNIDKK